MSYLRYVDDNPDALQEPTLQALYGGHATSGKYLTGVVPPRAAIAFVRNLAVNAKRAANSNACGSVLAGQTSESDEHEDVGIWLAPGDYGTGHERDTLDALGMKIWQNKKVSPMELDANTHLPQTFQTSMVTDEQEALTAQLGELTHLSFFAVPGGPNSTTAYVLLGRLQNEDGWAGLIGVGVAS